MYNSVLFPPHNERITLDHHLTELLADAELRVSNGPVTPTLDIVAFKGELAAFDFKSSTEMSELLAWTVARMESGLVHLNHPRYLGLFNPSPTFAAQCADRIAGSFNPQLASATTSPAAVEIEAHVIRAVARRAGLGSNAAGHFTSGGSEANFTAVICALTRAAPRFAEIGSRAFSGQPIFYVSQDCHLAWIKIAHQAGIGRDAARLVPTDGSGRMCMQALSDAIHADLANGNIPFMIAATAGTTNAGMIDPLEPIAKIARHHGLWFHIDAAWGGALIASERLRGLLAGIEAADSITIDAHKWFATTMGCGMFLTAQPEVLSAAFNVTASFMPSYAPAFDPYVTTAQWSRRFLGLRLFLSLAAGGWAGHAAHVERSFAMLELLTGTLKERGWSAANGAASLAVACLEPPAESRPVSEIVKNVLAAGNAWVSVASFEGRDVLRACVTHGQTSASDILRVAEALEAGRKGDSPESVNLSRPDSFPLELSRAS
jgi:glutamate/tyrosine decarboxylase-like PLP-dependent enzyme